MAEEPRRILAAAMLRAAASAFFTVPMSKTTALRAWSTETMRAYAKRASECATRCTRLPPSVPRVPAVAVGSVTVAQSVLPPHVSVCTRTPAEPSAARRVVATSCADAASAAKAARHGADTRGTCHPARSSWAKACS